MFAPPVGVRQWSALRQAIFDHLDEEHLQKLQETVVDPACDSKKKGRKVKLDRNITLLEANRMERFWSKHPK